MTRKIGDVFDYEGKKIEVKHQAKFGQIASCEDCFFDELAFTCTADKSITGKCDLTRDDLTYVVFVEVCNND